MNDKYQEFTNYLIGNNDLENASRLFKTMDFEKILPELKYDIYKMVPFMMYFFLDSDMDSLKQCLDTIDKEKDLYSKYELYIFYYFYGIYFNYGHQNYEAALFAYNLIDVKKLRRYLKFEYKDYFLGNILLDIGRNYTLLNEYDIAIEYFEKARKVFEPLDCHVCLSHIKIEIAVNKMYGGNYDEALKLLYNIQMESPNPLRVVYVVIGYIEMIKGNINKALLYHSFDTNKQMKWSKQQAKALSLYSKYLSSIINYKVDKLKESIDVFNSIDRLDIIANKDEYYFYELVKAYVYRDYSLETYNFIVYEIGEYFKENHIIWRYEIVKFYLEDYDKVKIL